MKGVPEKGHSFIGEIVLKPGLCNKIRYEALSHNKSGSLASKAWHRYGGKTNKAKRLICSELKT